MNLILEHNVDRLGIIQVGEALGVRKPRLEKLEGENT